MLSYDEAIFSPPAPVARVTLRDAVGGTNITDVPMLIDTGADVTLLPRAPVERLGVQAHSVKEYELIGFDGTRSFGSAVVLEMVLLARVFRGRYLLIDGDHGVLGRNVINHLVLLLDGPMRRWAEQSN